MIAGLGIALAGSAGARRAAGILLATAAILLFMVSLRRAGEKAGRAAERFETRERNHAIHRRMLDAAAAAPLIAMLWLTGCAAGGSDSGGAGACPPVVGYTTAEQHRAAREVEALPEGAMLVRMLADYAVLRDQARACR